MIFIFWTKSVLTTLATTKMTSKIPSPRNTVSHQMLQHAYQYRLTRFQWLPCNMQLETDYTQRFYHTYRSENSKSLNSEHIKARTNTRRSEF